MCAMQQTFRKRKHLAPYNLLGARGRKGVGGGTRTVRETVPAAQGGLTSNV